VKRRALGRCPVCGESLEVTKLSCPRCDTSISGHFETCKFCQMSDEQRDFVTTFIRCRGNIKEVERGHNYYSKSFQNATRPKALSLPQTLSLASGMGCSMMRR
jgi:hypothetical protein